VLLLETLNREVFHHLRHHFTQKQQNCGSITKFQLNADIELLDQSMPESLETVSDLEVFMIVRERLLDAHGVLEDIDYENISAAEFAYALERYNSGLVWSSFFGIIDSVPVDLSDAHMRRSCSQKLMEAEERMNYLSYTLGVVLDDTQDELSRAREDQRQGEWALCTFKASKAKAESEAVLSAMYAGGSMNQTVAVKLEKVREVLARQTARDRFPILAYAYYEYAQDLENTYSANLYAEYAM
jgi:predicted S18 family serine protease